MAQSLATAGGHVRFDRQQGWRSSTVTAVVSTTVTAVVSTTVTAVVSTTVTADPTRIRYCWSPNFVLIGQDWDCFVKQANH